MSHGVGSASASAKPAGWPGRQSLASAQLASIADLLKVQDQSYLFDAEIEDWYRPQFVQITALNDPEFDNPPAQAMERPASLLARLKKRLQHSGPPQPWTAAATSAVARWVHRRRRPIVISFAQPWTSHLAVLAAKRDYPGLKWAAHFSDPWVDSPYFTETEIKKRDAARQLEREIIGRADAVVFVTEETADLVMQKYPSDWRRKVRVIPHLLISLPSRTRATTSPKRSVAIRSRG